MNWTKIFVLCFCCWVLTLFTCQCSAETNTTENQASLAKLVQEGLAHNQDLQGMSSQLAGLQEKIPVAGALDDPRLGLGLLNMPSDSLAFDEEPMTQKQLFIVQRLPWFGKLDLRSQRATLAAQRQTLLLAAKRLELTRQIATNYYDLAFTRISREVNGRLQESLNQSFEAAEIKYGTGRGLRQDVLMVQVEIGRLLDENISLGKKERMLEDRLNELLGRQSFLPIATAHDFPAPEFSLDSAKLAATALRQNPWLMVKETEADQAKVELALAGKDYLPDLDVQVAYGQRDENPQGQDWQDFLSASVVMNIPLWKQRKQDRNLAAATANYEAALASSRQFAIGLPHRIDSLVADLTGLQKSYQHYRKILVEQTRRWAESSRSDYEFGRVEFGTMIDARIRALRFELQADNYRFAIYKTGAELEEILGSPVALGDRDQHIGN